ncbi:hypothetical protein BGZ58_004395, partial [Dissophora ornata]
MEPFPPHQLQPVATEPDDSDDPTVNDKLACDQIEQLILNVMNELGEYMATTENTKENRDDVDDDEDHGPVSNDGDDCGDVGADVGADVGIEPLKARIAEGLNGIVVSRGVRELLFNDTEILDSAKHYKVDPDSRFVRLDADIVEFYIHPDRFETWRLTHQRSISTNFVLMRSYDYKVDSQYRLSFGCQCAGQKQVRKDRVKGGTSGKSRTRAQGIKRNCPSKIFALHKLMTMADGSKVPVYLVEYHYQHNHSVGDITDLGTRQKSAAMRSTIERLILQGSTIQRVMQQLTMDYDKFTQITRGNGQQLSRDDFITYDDVFNIWHKITTRAMRKDLDPVLSAVKWMEELERNKGFTFYDRDDKTSGLYYGFASMWQLQQLRAHGRVLCFDGTHNVFGHKTNLFTLVLKNTDTGFGIPVAFLLTKTCDAFILSSWLTAIRRKMKDLFSTADKEYDFMPNVVITDQGSTEILAIKSAFSDVPIFYCAWHVLKVWEREVKKRMTGLGCHPIARRNEIRAQVRSDLRKILYEKNKKIALDLIDTFRETWSDQGELLDYLNKNYFGRPMLKPMNHKSWIYRSIGCFAIVK